MLTIDLRAPTIPVTQRVWRLFPGSGYNFLNDFHEQEVGFLDFPGLRIPDGGFSRTPDSIARIVAAAATRDVLRKSREIGQELPQPADFRNARHTQARGRLRQAIINFFEQANPGDLIVMPEPTYMGFVNVGRFEPGGMRYAYHPRRYGDVELPARPVRWLSRYRENTLSTPLSTSLRHPHPFTLLERSLYNEVLSLAYGSYVYGDQHSAAVFNSHDYLDSDSALIGTLSRLAAEAVRTISNGEDAFGKADLLRILLSHPDIAFTSNLAVDIHSPGFSRFISGKVTPLVVAALLAALIGLAEFVMAGADGNVTPPPELPRVEFVNSAHDADPNCTWLVSEASGRVLRALDGEELQRMCNDAFRAKQRAGIKPSAQTHFQP